MPINQGGVLSSNQKTVDFFSRLLDVLLLGLCLGLSNLATGRIWTDGSTFILLCAFLYLQLFGALFGLYASQRNMVLTKQYSQVALALSGAFALLAISAYASNSFHQVAGRRLLIWWYASGLLSLCFVRFCYRSLLGLLRRHGFNTRCAAIVGAGPLSQRLAQKFADHPWMGIRVGGFYDEDTTSSVALRGNHDDLIRDAIAGLYEQVYIAVPLEAQDKIKDLTDRLSNTTASVYFIPDIFIFDLMNSRHTSIDGIPAISIYDTPFSVTDNIIKRGFDIFGSLAILALIMPLMAAITIAIRTTSPGPVIFRQRRYGLDGRPIEIWKFRTMSVTEDGDVIRQAQRNDSRLTSIGGFLRRTSLDELPQFINVLQGSMSIVGPRPHAVAHNEQYRKLIKGYMLRHKVKPGITGWAQVNGWRGETETLEKMQKRVEYDLIYIRNWNLWLDVKIVFMTVFKGFLGKNAY